ncbi:MAG TPA: hypothetical protein PLL32_04985 [Anaeromyxobacteraceae bacterium]|nr:hypothetical protein [Anaeromyxobacteraceae bacterium]
MEEVGEWPDLRARFRLPHVDSAGAGRCGCDGDFTYVAEYDFDDKPTAMACRAMLGAYLAEAVARGPVQVFRGSSEEVAWYPLRGTIWATPQDFASDVFGGGGPPSMTLIEVLGGPPKD